MPLSEKVLSLDVDSLAKLQNPSEDISTIWNVITKCKDNLENGYRLENISWRLWYRSSCMKKCQTSLLPLCEPLEDLPSKRMEYSVKKSPLVQTVKPYKVVKKKLSGDKHYLGHLTPRATFFLESSDSESEKETSFVKSKPWRASRRSQLSHALQRTKHSTQKLPPIELEPTPSLAGCIEMEHRDKMPFKLPDVCAEPMPSIKTLGLW
ncbi:hypothetical protein EDD86DRAFT_210373 [Gorgonomyces haynaldii]|nr:hypothetical protein EDD86DRAFT_210373 [Gorgonomyces haynaldii]